MRRPGFGEPLGIADRSILKITRTTRRRKTTTSLASTEEFYLVTSLSAEQARPAELAAWARGHWSIEVIHHVRDRTMDEDRHTVRTKNAAQNWATFRDTTISDLRLAGHTNIKQVRAEPPPPTPASYSKLSP